MALVRFRFPCRARVRSRARKQSHSQCQQGLEAIGALTRQQARTFVKWRDTHPICDMAELRKCYAVRILQLSQQICAEIFS